MVLTSSPSDPTMTDRNREDVNGRPDRTFFRFSLRKSLDCDPPEIVAVLWVRPVGGRLRLPETVGVSAASYEIIGFHPVRVW